MIRRVIFFLLVAGPVGFAQTHPSILVKPWQSGPHWAETRDEVVVQDRADTRGGTDAGVFAWDSTGRLKLHRDVADPKLVIGYRVLTLSVDTDLPAINGSFWDVGVVAGGEVARFESGWRIQLLGGAGSANDGHFGDAEGLYGLGTVQFSRAQENESELMFGLSYDGHRLFLPDVPLPYVSYLRQLNAQLTAVVGVPFGGFFWRPGERWTVDATYSLPTDLKGRVSFHLLEKLSVFAEYGRTQDGFSIADAENRRLFFAARRVFGGIRWVTRLADLSVGGGYAFDQEFETGFDVRDTHTVTKVADAPFVMVRLDGTF